MRRTMRRLTKSIRTGLAVIMLTCPLAATAQEWNELDSMQQRILRPFESGWADFSPERRARFM